MGLGRGGGGTDLRQGLLPADLPPLSTAKYFTGQGNCLIGVGLTPDRVVELDEEQAAKLRARILDPAEDPQLQAAIAAA